MIPPSIVPPDSPPDPQADAAADLVETRPFYWSVRRELWEHRSVRIAPLVVTAVVLLASLVGVFALPRRMETLALLEPAQRTAVLRPFAMAPAPIMLATLLVGLFYSLDALYGERRDRSILFWKSLPVSDRTTVLAKASIPLLVLPLIALVLSVATVTLLRILGSAVLAASGLNPARLWSEAQWLQEPLIMLYGLTVHALWFAPIYGWLLLVSAWARRTPVLWAALPVVTFLAFERIAFGGSRLASLLGYRVTGAMAEAFADGPAAQGDVTLLAQLTPARFLAAPGLWLGLAFAGACLAAAVRLRRGREPI